MWHLFFHFFVCAGLEEFSSVQLHATLAIQSTDTLWKQPAAIRQQIIEVSNRGETDVSEHSPVGRITSLIKRALAQFLKGRMSGEVWCPGISEMLHTRFSFITNHFFCIFCKAWRPWTVPRPSWKAAFKKKNYLKVTMETLCEIGKCTRCKYFFFLSFPCGRHSLTMRMSFP